MTRRITIALAAVVLGLAAIGTRLAGADEPAAAPATSYVVGAQASAFDAPPQVSAAVPVTQVGWRRGYYRPYRVYRPYYYGPYRPYRAYYGPYGGGYYGYAYPGYW